MLLRISLVLAILAALGVIGVSQFMLRPQIEEIRGEREKNKEGWEKANLEVRNTKKSLKETGEKLTKTTATLEETKTQLASATTKLDIEVKRGNSLQETVTQLNGRLKGALDDLAAWTNSGVRVEEIKGLVATVKEVNLKNEVLTEENKIFGVKNKKLTEEIVALRGKDDQAPPVPREVRGKVLIVDPKWDFLVLDVGTKLNVPEKGILLISRNGELVAKVRVINAQEQRSIANILPGWKLKEVMEGDVVLPY